MLLLMAYSGCGDGGNGLPGTLRFGQVGEVRVELEVPLNFNGGEGELWQFLTWNSGGSWQIRESISYRGLPGDANMSREDGDPGEYAHLIAQLDDSPALNLFDNLEYRPVETCPMGDTRVTLTVRDEPTREERSWIRCSEGNLATLTTAEAGPDPEAVRVIQAAILLRDFTVGPQYVSAYSGSVPFGTFDRGEDSGAELPASREFFSEPPGSVSTPEGWVEFWREHTGRRTDLPPVVDWANEMVFVAAVGKRTEAGDSVEIRRILQTGVGTQVFQFERVPGNFCSPASRDHYPIHIVVAPRTLLPVDFSSPVEERVPCGF